MGLKDYMPHVQSMIDLYGIKSVFIAADNADVVKNATLFYPQVNWLYADLNRSMFNIFHKGSRYTMIEQLLFENRSKAYELGFSPAGVMDDALIDTYLAAAADAFVGNFASNMDRTAFALMSASRSSSATCIPPHISVGAPWCFDYGNKGGSFTRWDHPTIGGSMVSKKLTSSFWC